MSKSSRPETLFRIASEAAAKAGKCSPRFVCPLCRESFFKYDPDQLTEEHVPARALGGKVLTLTCQACNNAGGRLLQASQVERERTKRLWSARPSPPQNLEFATEEGIVRGEAFADDTGKIQFRVDPQRMSPVTLDRLEGAVRIEGQVHRQGRGFDWHVSRIADLRDAYLLVFAYFGYSMIANDAYEWVRRAIRDGTTDQSKWAIRLDDSFTAAAQKQVGSAVILGTASPNGAVVVANETYGCLLPTPFNPDPYASLGDNQANISFLPSVTPVPRRMHLVWDFTRS